MTDAEGSADFPRSPVAIRGPGVPVPSVCYGLALPAYSPLLPDVQLAPDGCPGSRA